MRKDDKQGTGLSLPFARIALVLAALVAVGAIAVTILRSRAADSPAPPSAVPAEPTAGDINQAIAGLEKKLAANPQDAAGWHMLGWSYYNVGRYPDAVRAYGRAAAIEPGNAEHWSALGEVQILSGPGGVIPDAVTSFRKAIAIDPKDFRARYFLAVKKDADGDHKAALDDLIQIAHDSPPGAPWDPAVRQLIDRIAKANNIDVANRLPPPATAPAEAPAAPGASVAAEGIPGPTPEQLKTASSLTPSQQDDMAKTMVARLAAKLEANPRDGDGWIRLMRARVVLGDKPAARAALQRAKTVFANDPAEQARLDEAAGVLGIGK